MPYWSDGFPWWLFIKQCLGAPGSFHLVHCNLKCVVYEIAKRKEEIVQHPACGGKVSLWPSLRVAYIASDSSSSVVPGRASLTAWGLGNVGQEKENQRGSGKCIALYLPPLSAWELLFMAPSQQQSNCVSTWLGFTGLLFHYTV